MWATVVALTALHLVASVLPYFRNSTGVDKELVLQHHEKCVMLGLIALAILWRTTT